MNIFVVLKNSDMTEGRGYMMFHRAFTSSELAHKYCQEQKGIWDTDNSKSKNGKYSGYEIIEVPLHDKILTVMEYNRIMDQIIEMEKQLSILREKIA